MCSRGEGLPHLPSAAEHTRVYNIPNIAAAAAAYMHCRRGRPEPFVYNITTTNRSLKPFYLVVGENLHHISIIPARVMRAYVFARRGVSFLRADNIT